MIPNPAVDFLAWDQPIIGGRKWSGIATVEGCDREVDVQIDKGKGSSGASTKIQGEKLAEPKITFLLYRGVDHSGVNFVDYFAEWESFKGVFELPLDDKNPQAITVEHPQFANNGIRACIVKKMGDLRPEPDGRVSITVELVEFRKSKPSGGTVKSAEKDGQGKGRAKSTAEENEAKKKSDGEAQKNDVPKTWKKSG